MSDDLTPTEQARAHRLSAKALYERNPNAFEASRYALGEIADHLDPPAPPETVESLRAERDAEHDAWERTEDALRQCRDERDEARSDGAHWREQFRLVCDESAARLEARDAAREKLAAAECVICSHIASLDAMCTERDEALAEMEEVGAARRQEQIMHRKAWATICNLQAELATAFRDNERFEGEQEELVQALSKLSAANDTIARLRATHTEAEAAWERCKDRPARMWHEGDSAPESYIRVRDKNGQVWVWHNYRPDHGSVWRTSDGGLIGAWDWLCEHRGPLTEVLP